VIAATRVLRSPTLAFARLAFTDLLAYRLRYIVGVLNYTIYMSVQYFLWAAVFASAPDAGAGIGSYRFEELVTYFAIGWIVRVSYYNNIDREIADRVGQGDIAIDLLRPVSLLRRYYGSALGEAVFRVLFMGVPTAAVLFPIFSVQGPALGGSAASAALRLAAFALSVALAFHVFFLIHFLIGSCSVFFEKIRGLIWAKFVLIQFLSGMMVPFELFPETARRVLELLPFRAIAYGPVSIYLGRASGAALWTELGLQALWLAGLWLMARALWSACRRKLQVQGG
jgi:ABC-2 type transport system permease protein